MIVASNGFHFMIQLLNIIEKSLFVILGFDILLNNNLLDPLSRRSSTISKTSARVSSGFQTRGNIWDHEAAGRVVLLFSSLWKPDETRSTSFWNYFSNKKNRSSCHFNEFSQIFFLRIIIFAFKATFFSLVVCQFEANTLLHKQKCRNGRNGSKKDLGPPKLLKKKKSVSPALFRSLPAI